MVIKAQALIRGANVRRRFRVMLANSRKVRSLIFSIKKADERYHQGLFFYLYEMQNQELIAKLRAKRI
jgi:hypothetical protein